MITSVGYSGCQEAVCLIILKYLLFMSHLSYMINSWDNCQGAVTLTFALMVTSMLAVI